MGIPAADGNSRDYEFGRSYYTVRSGDNLTTISKATGFPISVIAEANNITENIREYLYVYRYKGFEKGIR